MTGVERIVATTTLFQLGETMGSFTFPPFFVEFSFSLTKFENQIFRAHLSELQRKPLLKVFGRQKNEFNNFFITLQRWEPS